MRSRHNKQKRIKKTVNLPLTLREKHWIKFESVVKEIPYGFPLRPVSAKSLVRERLKEQLMSLQARRLEASSNYQMSCDPYVLDYEVRMEMVCDELLHTDLILRKTVPAKENVSSPECVVPREVLLTQQIPSSMEGEQANTVDVIPTVCGERNNVPVPVIPENKGDFIFPKAPLTREQVLLLRKERKEQRKLQNIILSQLYQENRIYKNSVDSIKKHKFVRNKLADLKWARNHMQDGKLDSAMEFMDMITDPKIVVPLTTIFQLFRARDTSDVVSALGNFMSTFKEQIKLSKKQICDLVVKFFSRVRMQDGWFETLDKFTFSVETFFTQSMDCLEGKTFKYIQEIYYFLWGIILDFFPPGDNPSDYVIKMKAQADKSEFTPFIGLRLLRGLNYILRRGIISVKTGNILHFFHEEAAYTTWLEEVGQLDVDEANINSPDEIRQVRPLDFVTKCDRLIPQGKEIASLMTGFTKKSVLRTVANIMIKKNAVMDGLLGQQLREAPFSVLLNSNPKYAKSTFASIIHKCFGKYTGEPVTKDTIYNRNFKDPFWSGFNSSKWCVVLDDIANENPNYISSVYESSTAEVIQVINNVAYLPNMASLDEKGRTICMPKLVIGTTNNPRLNAKKLFYCPYAIYRRFQYVIDLQVKEEYQDSVDGGLDSSKLPVVFERTGQVLDVWNIWIYKINPEGKKYDVHRYDSIPAFLCWLESAIKDHQALQKKVMAHDDYLENATICGKCYGFECNCPPTEAVMQDGWDRRYLDDRTQERINFLKVSLQWMFVMFVGFITGDMYYIAVGSAEFLKNWVFPKALNCALRYYLPRKIESLRLSLIGNNGPFIQGMLLLLNFAIAFLTSYLAARTVASIFAPRDNVKEEPTAVMQGAMMSSSEDKYYNPMEVTRNIDLGRKTLSWKGLEQQQVVDAISRNVVCIKTIGTNRKFGCGLFLGGNILVTNYHLFSYRRQFEIIFKPENMSINKFIVNVADSDVYCIAERDMMFMRIRQMPNFKSVIDLFPNSLIPDLSTFGTMINRTREGLIQEYKGITRYRGYVTCKHEETKRVYLCPSYYISGPITRDGECGSPYLAWLPAGPTLLGLHQSYDACPNACSILRSDIDAALDFFGPIVQGGTIEGGKSFPMHDLSRNSTLRQIKKPNCEIIASTGMRFPTHTHVENSLIYDDVCERGVVDIWAGPHFDREAWINAMAPLLEKGDSLLDLNLLDKASNMYIHEIVDHSEIYDETHVLNLDEAVNGIDGVAFIDKIDRKTSAGFPYCTSKKTLIDLIDNKAVPCAEILNEVERLRSIYADSCRAFPIFMGTLKDEVLKKTKVEAHKTRLFTGSPFAFSIIFRQYYLPLVATMQNQPELFEAYVGVNAMGKQWCRLYEHLCAFGEDRICAGDYQAFDKTMCPAIVLEAFRVLMALAKRAGYSDEDLLIMNAMSYDIAFPVVNLDGDIVMVYGMNPSGHPLTVTINCIVNCLLLRMAFIHYNPDLNFKDYVHLATYGDDNIFGVKDGCEFDHTLLSDFLAKQGIVYTMADKETISVPYIHISEGTFLKRSFVFSEPHGCVVGPLDIASVHRSLLHVIPSKAQCREDQLIAQMNTNLLHLSLHNEELFNSWRDFFMKMIDKYELHPFLGRNGLFTWQYLLSKFLGDCLADEEEEEEGSSVEPRLQCGCIPADEDEHCFLCGFDDCVLANKLNAICPRCGHCRHWEVIEDDTWFLGCWYCEVEYPLTCDWCLSPTIDIRVRLDSYHNMFYCKQCYVSFQREKELRQGKNASNQSKCRPHCDPIHADELPFRRLLREIREESKESSPKLGPSFTNVDVLGKGE